MSGVSTSSIRLPAHSKSRAFMQESPAEDTTLNPLTPLTAAPPASLYTQWVNTQYIVLLDGVGDMGHP